MARPLDDHLGLFGDDESFESSNGHSELAIEGSGEMPTAQEATASESPTPDAQPEASKTPDGKTSKRRTRINRSFPAATFEEALELPRAIQAHAGGQRIRRMRLFELLGRSPESSQSRQLVTNSSRYGLTTGSYNAEWLELTSDGHKATADNVPEREKLRAQFTLAVEGIAPFKSLYERFKNNRAPAKGVMVDFLREEGLNADEVSECVDTFLLNAQYIGLLRTMSGAERIVTIEYLLDYAAPGVQPAPSSVQIGPAETKDGNRELRDEVNSGDDCFSKICFYITPIGDDTSEQRKHSDLFLGSIIEPALEDFGLKVVRADKIASAGMITRQVIEHIIRSRLVIADLSFHNPNVFYELALRHATGLPTVQIMRSGDRIPFDVNQIRTIIIDTSSIYTLVPKIELYRSEIATHVRRALDDPESVDNPVTPFYETFRVR